MARIAFIIHFFSFLLWEIVAFKNLPALTSVSSRLYQIHHLRVYDHVLNVDACKIVDDQAKECGLGHTVYHRKNKPRTSVEEAIESVLVSLGDKSPMVEYWWREEWMNLECHRDVDEKRGQYVLDVPLLVPENAHVLYLHVGSEVHGPTVILHDTQPRSASIDGSIVDISLSASDKQQQFDHMSVVPALSGRLLRFDGKLMHCVPRPALAYLDEEEGGSNLELWTRRRPSSDDDPELTVFRRSVLLFNTWRQNNESPMDIPCEPNPRSVDMYEKQATPLACNPMDQWTPRNECEKAMDLANAPAEGRSIHLKLGLLGTKRRRERDAKYLNLNAPFAIKSALLSDDGTPVTIAISEQ